MKDKYPYLFVILGAMLWGTTGTAQSLAPDGSHPIAIGACRLAIGGIALLLFAAMQGKLSWHNWPIKETLLAALGMACYQPFFFMAVNQTGIAVGTIITLSSAPIIAGYLEWAFWKRRPAAIWWPATALSIVGCLLLYANQGTVPLSQTGVLLALGAGASFALYTVVSKKILEKQPPVACAAIVFFISGLALSPMLLIYDISWLKTANGLAVGIHLGLFATAAAYLLFNKGLISVPSSTAVSLALAEPLTAAILGVFLVGETLSPLSWFGVGLLFCGIVLLTAFPKRTATTKQPLHSIQEKKKTIN